MRNPNRHGYRGMQTVVAEILAAWRRAERLAAGLETKTDEQAARRACEHLRAAYRELTDSGTAHAMTPSEAREMIANLDPSPDLA